MCLQRLLRRSCRGLAAVVLSVLLAACADGGGAAGGSPPDDDDAAPPSLVVWFEQPSIGGAADFFATQYRSLVSYLTAKSQQNFATHRVVVRVLDPAVTWTGGQQPWRVDAGAEFVADLMCGLPAGYELFVLPSGDTWTYAPEIADPIGKQMYWVQQIDAVAPAGCVRIAGFVLDPDASTAGEKEALIDEMNAQRPEYLPPAPAFRVGMTFGADALKKSLGYLAGGAAHPLDETYIEVYNIYTSTTPPEFDALPGSTETIYTANRNRPAGAFSAFASLLSAEPNLWGSVDLDAATAARVVLLFSVENIEDGNCIAPNAANGKCGQIDAFGTWDLSNTLDFLDTFGDGQARLFAAGSAAIPETNFGIFQYNFLPPVEADPAPAFDGVAFFADDVGGVVDTLAADFPGAGLIGEISPAERILYGKTFKVGMTCALAQGPQTPWWSGSMPPLGTPRAVLEQALAYPSEFPAAGEPIVYSQDLAYIVSDPDLSYPQAAALMWAARQLLPGMPIWPNMGHTLMQSTGYDADKLKTALVDAGVPAADWDYSCATFPEFLTVNKLVDGFIAQEYSTPGQVDFAAAGLDYVLQCDATKPLPATSSYCAGTGLPWRAAFYLPDTSVPSPAAVAAVVPRADCQ